MSPSLFPSFKEEIILDDSVLLLRIIRNDSMLIDEGNQSIIHITK